MSYAAISDEQIKEIPYAKIFFDHVLLAAPIGLTFTINALVVAVGIMSGRIEGNREQNLASSALIMSMVMTFLAVAVTPMFSVNFYSTVRVGQIKEKEKNNLLAATTPEARATAAHDILKLKDEISSVWQSSIILTAPILPIPVAAMYFSEWTLMHVFGQEQQVSALAQNFLRPYAFIPVVYALVRMPFDQLLFALMRAYIAMLITIFSFSVGLGIAYLLAFGKDKVPALGFSGMAYGFIVESVLTCLLMAAYLGLSKDFKDYNFFQKLFANPFTAGTKARIKELAQSAIPNELITTSQLAAPLVLNVLAGRFSTTALAVQSYSSWLIFFLIIAQLSLAYAAAQLVNHSRGVAREQTEAKGIANNRAYINTVRTVWGSVANAVLVMLPLCILAMAYPQLIINIVSSLNTGESNDANTIITAQNAIRITAIGIICDTLANTKLQISKALGDNNIPTSMSISCLWLGVALSYVLANFTNLGILGFSTGYTLGNALSVLPLGLRLAQRTKLSALAFAPSVQAEQQIEQTAIEATDKTRLLADAANP